MIQVCVFDLETNGKEPLEDRIITAYVGLLDPEGNVLREQEWIVKPPVQLSPEAAAIHGWTEEKLDADPRTRHDLDAVVHEIASLIYAVCGTGFIPLTGHNLGYDLTMLNAHLDRAGIARLPFGPIFVLDSLVLDKHYDKYVKGSGQRKLVPTAARYGVPISEDDAHDASFDATASGRIVQRILGRYVRNIAQDHLGVLANLHEQQKGWYAEQQRGLQKWLRSSGTDPQAVLETAWPTHNSERTAA